MPLAASPFILAGVFVASLGVNTHIDFEKYGYENLPAVAGALNYLGVKHVRDSAQKETDLEEWKQLADAAHVKFNAYIPQGSPADMERALGFIPPLAAQGILAFVEGGNEEDGAYAVAKGNGIAAAAAFQRKVDEMSRGLGLAAINLSFGAGWTAANNWHGNYDKVGDLSEVAAFANAHVYPAHGPGEPAKTIRRLMTVAKLAAASRPVMITELGWKANTIDDDTIARSVVMAALDAAANGAVKVYYYALFDDMSGHFGLMNGDGTPRAAGRALHNLTTLLADTGRVPATPLTYEINDKAGGENSLLMAKSDGSYWLAVWDEVDPQHEITVGLPVAAASLEVFDPVAGTTAIQTARNAASLSVSLANHPLFVRIVPAGG